MSSCETIGSKRYMKCPESSHSVKEVPEWYSFRRPPCLATFFWKHLCKGLQFVSHRKFGTSTLSCADEIAVSTATLFNIKSRLDV